MAIERMDLYVFNFDLPAIAVRKARPPLLGAVMTSCVGVVMVVRSRLELFLPYYALRATGMQMKWFQDDGYVPFLT